MVGVVYTMSGGVVNYPESTLRRPPTIVFAGPLVRLQGKLSNGAVRYDIVVIKHNVFSCESNCYEVISVTLLADYLHAVANVGGIGYN